MRKYKFDYLNNTLAYQNEEGDLWHQIAEEQTFTGSFDQPGFKLNNGWMTFAIYETGLSVFAKLADEWGYTTYYRKYLTKTVPVIFEFSESDEMEKTEKGWVKKGGGHA